MDIKEIIAKNVAIIRFHLPGSEWNIFLFGSQVEGTAEERSDIDLAIDGPHSIPLTTLHQIRGSIDALPTLRSVDIVDLAQKDEEFRLRIRTKGKSLSLV